jgi:hypothetical protein
MHMISWTSLALPGSGAGSSTGKGGRLPNFGGGGLGGDCSGGQRQVTGGYSVLVLSASDLELELVRTVTRALL